MSPLVAVVTPVYNGARTLADTLASVQAQTYAPLVHVVLDNASRDETPALLAQAAAGARRPLLVTRNPATLPLMANWNAAMRLVPPEAKYVRLLCADDRLRPDAIARMTALAEAHADVTVVLSGLEIGGAAETWRWPAGGPLFDAPAIIRGYFRDEFSFYGNQALLRVAALARRPGPYDETLYCADQDLCLALIREAGVVAFDPEPLAILPGVSGAISSTVMFRDFLHYPEWLVLLERHAGAGLARSELETLTRRFLRHYLRKLLRWTLSADGRRRVRAHLSRLTARGRTPGVLDFADAVLDWPLKQLGLRPRWDLFPW